MELPIRTEQLRISTETGELEARLWLPEQAVGLVVLAGEYGGQRLHGAGDYLPSVLREARLATLVFDFSAHRAVASAGSAEERTERATQCVCAACDWAQEQEEIAEVPLGLAGIGVGGIAVLHAGVALGRRVCALVARGMRVDPNCPGLASISAPTLLIAGSLDEAAVETSRNTYTALRCGKRFEIVPGATRAFDEPGSVEVVARLMRNWFVQHVHLRA